MLSKSTCELLIEVALLIRHKHPTIANSHSQQIHTSYVCPRNKPESRAAITRPRLLLSNSQCPLFCGQALGTKSSRNGNSALKSTTKPVQRP